MLKFMGELTFDEEQLAAEAFLGIVVAPKEGLATLNRFARLDRVLDDATKLMRRARSGSASAEVDCSISTESIAGTCSSEKHIAPGCMSDSEYASESYGFR